MMMVMMMTMTSVIASQCTRQCTCTNISHTPGHIEQQIGDDVVHVVKRLLVASARDAALVRRQRALSLDAARRARQEVSRAVRALSGSAVMRQRRLDLSDDVTQRLNKAVAQFIRWNRELLQLTFVT